jgi:hypothetical protein
VECQTWFQFVFLPCSSLLKTGLERAPTTCTGITAAAASAATSAASAAVAASTADRHGITSLTYEQYLFDRLYFEIN